MSPTFGGAPPVTMPSSTSKARKASPSSDKNGLYVWHGRKPVAIRTRAHRSARMAGVITSHPSPCWARQRRRVWL